MASISDDEIVYDSPFLRLYKSGRTERFFPDDFAPPSLHHPLTGVSSKDVSISPDTGVSARLYLPDFPSDEPRPKLPLLVYFHGGGFCIGSAFSSFVHNYFISFVAQARVILVSVEYRLAPEHLVPAAFHDSLTALRWVASHLEAGCGSDDWLTNHGDFDRLFLAGESAGATLAHYAAMHAAEVDVSGVVLVHPYFLAVDEVESDAMDRRMSEGLKRMWKMVCPSTTGFDDPLINPLAGGAPRLSGLACKRVMVCVAEGDVLRDRGRAYFDGLKGSGWGGEVELFESEGVGHVFHFGKPESEKALELKRAISDFLNLG